MKILMIGGTGFVGRNLYEYLSSRHEITLVSRHKVDWAVAGKNWSQGNIVDPTSLSAVLSKGFDVVVDLAAVINQREERHRDVNDRGTANLASLLADHPATKLVYMSAINSDRGSTEYFRTKLAAEKNIQMHENNLIIRPSVFYGENDYLTAQLVKTAVQVIPGFPKSGPMCPVYIKDFAVVFESLLTEKGIVNVCSNEKLTLGAMLNIVRKRLGKGPVREMPLALFSAMAPVLDIMGVIGAEQLAMLKYDFYRADTVLYKYVKQPMEYEKFISGYIK